MDSIKTKELFFRVSEQACLLTVIDIDLIDLWTLEEHSRLLCMVTIVDEFGEIDVRLKQ